MPSERRPQELLTVRQRHPRPGAAIAGQVSAHRRPGGRSGSGHSRHPGVLPSSAGARRLADRLALPDMHDHRHARLFRQRLERGLEGGDGGGGSETPGTRPANCPPKLQFAGRLPRTVRLSPGRPRRAGAALSAGRSGRNRRATWSRFCRRLDSNGGVDQSFPLIVLVDDSDFTARSLNNWLWVTFTRSNPAADVHGIGSVRRGKSTGAARGRW